MHLPFKRFLFTVACALYITWQPLTAIGDTPRMITPQQWQQLTGDKTFGYKNDKEGGLKAVEHKQNLLAKFLRAFFEFFGNGVGNALLWLLFTGLILYLVYHFMMRRDSFLFGKGKGMIKDTGPPGENLEDISATNWEALFKEAAGRNDIRHAVRYNYMWLLQLLQQQELIRYRNDKTNHEYYNELKENDHKKIFRQLSMQYEYAWYGHFNLADVTYHEYLTAFDKFKKDLGA